MPVADNVQMDRVLDRNYELCMYWYIYHYLPTNQKTYTLACNLYRNVLFFVDLQVVGTSGSWIHLGSAGTLGW